MTILIIVLVLVLLVAGIVLARTCTLKPTAAQNATVSLDTSDRAKEYGEQLAKLVKKEKRAKP